MLNKFSPNERTINERARISDHRNQKKKNTTFDNNIFRLHFWWETAHGRVVKHDGSNGHLVLGNARKIRYVASGSTDDECSDRKCSGNAKKIRRHGLENRHNRHRCTAYLPTSNIEIWQHIPIRCIDQNTVSCGCHKRTPTGPNHHQAQKFSQLVIPQKTI